MGMKDYLRGDAPDIQIVLPPLWIARYDTLELVQDIDSFDALFNFLPL